MRNALGRAGVDPYLLAILGTVGLAALFPARGGAAHAVSLATEVAIGLLFFLYGARLSPRAALDGAKQWRLHLTILLATFALFPLLGVAAQALTAPVLGTSLAKGVLFLTLLPSTVQSSIAFTSIAGGNVAAAVCAASFSSLVGIALTPLLTAALMGGSARVDAGSAVDLLLQLLLPFLAGQLSRRWIAGWISRHKPALTLVDRGSILLVVYGAFSEGMVAGVWSSLSLARLALLLGVCLTLLFAVLGVTTLAGRRSGFSREDRIVLIFCGSKKSLASGLPMAAVLFPASAVSLTVLPLMLFHQIQLMACTVIARRMQATRQGRGELREKPPTWRAPNVPGHPHAGGTRAVPRAPR
ncbi:bile acid:sodium symporter family protein [Streptacidiphilus anmyonensis]|uniref:bile acid:sodium symporter family protein n=1 Tax=Streptacidiphilus anmyonensis TaxID=405782 RepID=UPI000A04A13D|nr:bile acid:sodium symporter family protein [Streptacidiphilus anmyonensis]